MEIKEGDGEDGRLRDMHLDRSIEQGSGSKVFLVDRVS